jgi:hypothetical protein
LGEPVRKLREIGEKNETDVGVNVAADGLQAMGNLFAWEDIG